MSKTGCFVIGYIVGGLIGIFAYHNSISNTPTAMDVYQNKTTLKYIVVDGETVDSCVIYKN